MKKKRKEKRIILYIVISVLVLLLIVPLIVNALFKLDFGIELFRAEWAAADALVYCGTIISVFVAIGGVLLSIRENNRANKENNRINTLPYIVFGFCEQKGERVEVKAERVIKLCDGKWKPMNLTSREVEDLKGEYIKERKGRPNFNADRIDCWCTVKNTGVGTALVPTVFGYRADEKDVGVGRVQLSEALSPGEMVSIILYSDNITSKEDKNIADYNFVFEYFDIWGNQYRMKNTLSLCRDNFHLGGYWCTDWQPELIGNINDIIDERKE